MANATDWKNSPTSEGVEKGKKRHKRLAVTLCAFLFLFIVLFYLSTAENTADVTRANSPNLAPVVSIEAVSVAPKTISVNAYAEVRPRWSAELRSLVSGRITGVEERALTGEPVGEGQLLISIETTQYEAELAAAEHALDQTRLALRKAENNTQIARNEFKRNGTKPPSDLSLHLPELKIAQKAVSSAEARVALATKQLNDASIKAPFSGYIAERFVSLGQTVNPGDRLIKIVENKAFEVTVELGRHKWDLLQHPLEGAEAQLLDENGELLAHAAVRRGGGFLDQTTRQYKVFLETAELENKHILSGDFVQVSLPGVTVSKALDIAETSLTQEGYIWYVDNEDRLARLSPTILSRNGNRVIIEAPEQHSNWRIAIAPLASFLPGQQVTPTEVER